MKLIITNMKKETAVEALSEYIRIVDKKVYADLKEIIEQAKQMEKEQHEETWSTAWNESAKSGRFEQYYNETFGGEQC